MGARRNPAGLRAPSHIGGNLSITPDMESSLRVSLNDEQLEQVIKQVLERLKEALLDMKKDKKDG